MGMNVRGLESLFMAWLWQKHQILSDNSHIIGIDKIMIPPIELLKCRQKFSSLVSLSRQSHSEKSSSFDKILIPRAGSCITD